MTFISADELRSVTSSANTSSFDFSTCSDRSFMYTRKSKGPKTDPLGTPDTTSNCFDFDPPICTLCLRLLRYDLNQKLC